MREQRCEAVVLRHLDYGEADRIVTFYTREAGQIKGFARQARKSRRRFGAALEPFARVQLHWRAAARGDLVSLREAELLDLRSGLRRDLIAVALAGYGCELVEELFAEGQPHPGVYDLLRAFLDHLDANGGSPEARLLFELRILHLAGYAPHLLHCSECGETLKSSEVAFEAARGGSLCLTCAPEKTAWRLTLPTLGTLARILAGPAELFAGFTLSERTLIEGGGLLGGALRLHLNRPLKSLPFLEQMLRETASPQRR